MLGRDQWLRAPKEGLDTTEDQIHVEGLGDKEVGVWTFVSGDGHGAHRDNGPYRDLFLTDAIDQPVSVDNWHHQVGQDNIRWRLFGKVQRLLPVAGSRDAKSFVLENEGQKFTNRRFIVDDENARRNSLHGASGRSAGRHLFTHMTYRSALCDQHID